MIAAILLAAGNARRFDGSQKLLALVAHRGSTIPLVRIAALGLRDAGIKRILVVVGREAAQVRACLDGLDLHFAMNDAYESGMSSSLRAGVSAATRLWPDTLGFIIALGDQPLGGTGILEAILASVHESTADAARRLSRPIVAPRFRGELGNPVLFARELVPELMEVSGDRGARAVIERDQSRVYYVDFDADMPPDVDTVSDLAALTVVPRYR